MFLPLIQETTEKRALPQKKPAWSTSRMAEPRKLIKKQDRYKWFLAFNQKKKYTLATDTAYEDQNKLTEAVKNLKCMQKDNMEKACRRMH